MNFQAQFVVVALHLKEIAKVFLMDSLTSAEVFINNHPAKEYECHYATGIYFSDNGRVRLHWNGIPDHFNRTALDVHDGQFELCTPANA